MDIIQKLFIDEKGKDFPKEGIIELIPIKPNKFEIFVFKTYKKDGLWYGVPTSKNTDGTYDFKRIILNGQTQYNCANEEERWEAMVVSNHPYCKDSPFYNGKAIWRIEDKIKEAEKEVNKIETSLKAVEIAMKIQGEELFDFARVLGFTPEIDHPTVTRKKVMERANRSPGEFLDQWKNVNREILQVIHRCLALNLIKNTPNTGYTWKDGQPLGNSEHAVIVYLLSNERFLNQMNYESKEVSDLHKTPKAQETVSTPNTQDSQKEIKKETDLMDKGAQKAEAISNTPQDTAEGVKAAPIVTEKDGKLLDLMKE